MKTISEKGVEESMLVSVRSGEYKMKNPKTPDPTSAKAKKLHDLRVNNGSCLSSTNEEINSLRNQSNDKMNKYGD